MPCNGVTTRSGNTVALPPPWVRANFALCPITATRLRVFAAQGNSGPPVADSFRTSTAPAISAARANAIPSSTTTGAATAGSKPSRAPTRAASVRMRSTLRSTADSATSPDWTAATSASPHGPAGPGITRSWE